MTIYRTEINWCKHYLMVVVRYIPRLDLITIIYNWTFRVLALVIFLTLLLSHRILINIQTNLVIFLIIKKNTFYVLSSIILLMRKLWFFYILLSHLTLPSKHVYTKILYKSLDPWLHVHHPFGMGLRRQYYNMLEK